MSKRKKKSLDRSEEDELERELFGGAGGRSKAQSVDAGGRSLPLAEVVRLERERADEEGEEEDNDVADGDLSLLIMEDRKGDRQLLRESDVEDEDEEGEGGRPAWVDPEDEAVNIATSASRLRKLRKTEEETVIPGKEYEARLRQQHILLHPRTGWAQVDPAEVAEEEDVFLRSDALTTAPPLGAGTRLPPTQISVARLTDANVTDPSDAVVQSVQFHPTLPGLMLTAGFDKKLRYFQVDGKKNLLVQGVHFEDLPIHTAAFVGPDSVLCSGRRKFFYLHHLEESRVERISNFVGRREKSYESFAVANKGSLAGSAEPLVAFLGAEGSVPLFSLRSRQPAGTLRMSGTVRSAAFSPSGLELMTAGGDGAICLWDLRMRRCLDRKMDEGAFVCTSLDVASDGLHYASGSDSGGVNVYTSPRRGILAKKPSKTLLNLTTVVDNLSFNGDGQILAMSSRMKKESLRLMHWPSGTVFANWPTNRTPLHYVHSLGFSPDNELLAMGNAKGKVLLYRFLHYSEEELE